MFADENVSKQITMKGFYVPAALSLMLLSLPIAAQSVATDTILLATFNDSISLDEVVIKAHKTPRANSRWSDLQPVDLVTVGGSNGDLYRALQTLPGVQLQGESGRLLVRGGNSNETQTYIDGMHVLNPYTTTGTDTPARGLYSTFSVVSIWLPEDSRRSMERLCLLFFLWRPKTIVRLISSG